jgi:hypothetical protein
MAPTPREQAHRPADSADPFAAWSTAVVESCMRLQRLQWDALAFWQESLATFNEDVWEQWASRYAGGVPIDA